MSLYKKHSYERSATSNGMRKYSIVGVRICVDILIAISIFFLTPWAPLLLVIGAIFYFKNFYEAIAAGVLIDMLYGVSLVKFFHTQWAMTLLFLFIYFIFNYAKRYTRFYGSR